MADIRFQVHRFNPETDEKPYYQEYQFTPLEGSTVLDCLNYIKWHLDDTLAYRMSCRSAICGSCAMRVNGHAKLVCQTQVKNVVRPDGTVRIDPVGNMPVLKDLIADMHGFWTKMQAVKPYLMPTQPPPSANQEYLQLPEAFRLFEEEATCIMCGACVSDCTSLESDKQFLGPAALAKAYRFSADTRDGRRHERLEELIERGGMWDCVRCNECVQTCPKTVAPMEAILKLRQMALKERLTDSIGARHVTVFTDIVGRRGILDERELPVRSLGFNPVKLLGMAPVALQSVLKGKIRPLEPPHKVKGVEDVQRIHREMEDGS
ncbi:MAG: succinate dehydrogenase/fumarate reductase iron-sulfur subunit [Armatimonadetes bacterium]|nr:succinate dehydrogenase/fumarate reductase iron-sulfur subunit [Armatimonadota bacterium]